MNFLFIELEILDLFDTNNVYGSKWIEFARAVETKLEIYYTNKAKNFTAELNATTIRYENITKSPIITSYKFFYPITIIEYFVDYVLKVESTCFDPNKNVSIVTLKNDQLLQSDNLDFDVIKKPSFIELNLTRIETEIYHLYISSSEEFDEIDLDVEFSINNNSNIASKQLITCKVCGIGENGQNDNNGLSTGAIVGIGIGITVFLLIVGIIIFKVKRITELPDYKFC